MPLYVVARNPTGSREHRGSISDRTKMVSDGVSGRERTKSIQVHSTAHLYCADATSQTLRHPVDCELHGLSVRGRGREARKWGFAPRHVLRV